MHNIFDVAISIIEYNGKGIFTKETENFASKYMFFDSSNCCFSYDVLKLEI